MSQHFFRVLARGHRLRITYRDSLYVRVHQIAEAYDQLRIARYNKHHFILHQILATLFHQQPFKRQRLHLAGRGGDKNVHGRTLFNLLFERPGPAEIVSNGRRTRVVPIQRLDLFQRFFQACRRRNSEVLLFRTQAAMQRTSSLYQRKDSNGEACRAASSRAS